VHESNPLEYCIKATGIKIEALENQSPEYKLIKEYVDNTYTDVPAANNQDR